MTVPMEPMLVRMADRAASVMGVPAAMEMLADTALRKRTYMEQNMDGQGSLTSSGAQHSTATPRATLATSPVSSP
jgi:hypothetical protein